MSYSINRFQHLPAMKNARLNVAGIHRQLTMDRFENSSSWTSMNPSRTSGLNDLSMPGNRKLANAHPPTTYQAQLSSKVRCWRSCCNCWWCWSRHIDFDDSAALQETRRHKKWQLTQRVKRHLTRGNSAGFAKEVFWMFKHSGHRPYLCKNIICTIWFRFLWNMWTYSSLSYDMKTNEYNGECVHMLYLNSKSRQPPKKNCNYVLALTNIRFGLSRILEPIILYVCRWCITINDIT